MNHMRKTSAVAKFSALKAEGKTADEIKEAVLADEKAYTQDEAAEIVTAVMEAETQDQIDAEPVYTVVQRFRHADSFEKFYEEGDDVSHLPAEKLAHLVSISVIKKEE